MKRILNTMFVLFISGAQLGHAADQAAALKRPINRIAELGVQGLLSWAQERPECGVRKNLCPFDNCPTQANIKATALQMHLSSFHSGWEVTMGMEKDGKPYRCNNMLKPWRKYLQARGRLLEEYNSQKKTFSWTFSGDSKSMVVKFKPVSVAKTQRRKKISQMRDFYREYAAIICKRLNIRDIDKKEFLKNKGKDCIENRIVYLEYLIEYLSEQDYETYIGKKVRQKDASFTQKDLNDLAQKEIAFCKIIAPLRSDDERDGRCLRKQREALQRLLEKGFQAEVQRKVYLVKNLTTLHFILQRIQAQGAQVFTDYTYTFEIDVAQDQLEQKVKDLIAQGKNLYFEQTGKDFVLKQDNDDDEVSDSDADQSSDNNSDDDSNDDLEEQDNSDDEDRIYQSFLQGLQEEQGMSDDNHPAGIQVDQADARAILIEEINRKRKKEMPDRVMRAKQMSEHKEKARQGCLERIRKKTAERKRKSEGDHA